MAWYCMYIYKRQLHGQQPIWTMSNCHAKICTNKMHREEKKRKRVRTKVGVIIAQLKLSWAYTSWAYNGAVYM
jgi:hypothetical protein